MCQLKCNVSETKRPVKQPKVYKINLTYQKVMTVKAMIANRATANRIAHTQNLQAQINTVNITTISNKRMYSQGMTQKTV